MGEAEAEESEALTEYPLQLGLAYLFLAGYFVRSIFVSCRLPASVGVMVSGFIFSYFFQEEVHNSRNELQELAFFLVLLTAGLEISLSELKWYNFVFAVLPSTVELLAIATFAWKFLDFTPIEGLVLGTVLFAVGDGLVIPKMKELSEQYSKHRLPNLVFIGVPIEASWALVLFGVLSGLSDPAKVPKQSMSLLVAANVLRVVATIVVGGLLGWGSARFVDARSKLVLFGKNVFTGKPVESFLVLVSVALLGFGLGSGKPGHEAVPMKKIIDSAGSLFQPELMVIVIGAFFSDFVTHEALHSVEEVLGGVWVFGQVVLFSMLGSRTKPEIFPKITSVLPIMAVGLLFRLIGWYVALRMTYKSRPPQNAEKDKWSALLPNTLFCFLSTMPRATIQGALGMIPITARFFHNDPERKHVEAFIGLAAKLYIVFMAVFGMILLNTFGPRLLECDNEAMEKAMALQPPTETEMSEQGVASVQYANLMTGSSSMTGSMIMGSPRSADGYVRKRNGTTHQFGS